MERAFPFSLQDLNYDLARLSIRLLTYPQKPTQRVTTGPPPASIPGQGKADGVCAAQLPPAQAPFPTSPWESSGRLQQRAPACINTLTGKRQVTESHRANSPLVRAGSCLACACVHMQVLQCSGRGADTQRASTWCRSTIRWLPAHTLLYLCVHYNVHFIHGSVSPSRMYVY